MQVSNEVPLTFPQKVQLFIECLPLPFFLLGLIFVFTILGDITGVPPSMPLILFLIVVTLVVGWIAINRVRDLLSGIALVQEDMLHQARRSRGSAGPNRFRGRFEQLGAMRLSTKAWGQCRDGERYRVYYSPASKIVWSLEAV